MLSVTVLSFQVTAAYIFTTAPGWPGLVVILLSTAIIGVATITSLWWWGLNPRLYIESNVGLLVFNLLYRPGWPHRDLPASASRVLIFKAFATMPVSLPSYSTQDQKPSKRLENRSRAWLRWLSA